MKKRFAQWLLKILGWRLEGAKPQFDRYVLIAAPHTSNWDFPLMLLFAAAFDIKITWMGKHTLFKWPMGTVMRALGGMPIYRHKNQNLVSATAEALEQATQLVLVVPAEGTRRRTEHWKSGFYHIACKAKVPIVPSFLDFKLRRGGFGPALETSGIASEDMQYFRDFYQGMEGKFPDQVGPIRLRDEEESQ